MSEKIRLGKGKTIEGTGMTNFSICLDSIPQEHINEYKGKRYVKCTLYRFDEPDQWGKDVAVYLNTWKPKEESKEDEQSF